MDDLGPELLARWVADAITGLTGQLWDGEARARLAGWLDDPEHFETARRWLETPETDPGGVDWTRQRLSRVLAGESRSVGGFVGVLRLPRWRRLLALVRGRR
jgi:hypothetical protein